MDSNKFKKCGYECVEWAIRYMETLNERKPLPQVEPGWLWDVVPATAPEKGEGFDKIMRDMEPVVLNGMAHWQHRQFFSYFPAGNSWSSIMGDVFSNATGVNGTNWSSCPVVTELEMIVCDWCCNFLSLPRFFLSKMSCPESEGAGIIQHSASEAIFYSMIWAREDAVRKLRQKYPSKPRGVLLNMLVAYCNNECHSCVERGSLMGCVHLRKLEPDNEGGIRAETLRKAIKEDMGKGLIPFFHVAIIGSTGITSSDDLMEVGPLCEEYGIWLHCDAAYAGSCFACMEMRHMLPGYEYVWSTNVNTNKWMMCNFEASLHWVRYAAKAVDPMTGWEDEVWKTPLTPDLKHYAVPATRRFRAFKLWCVIRNYGVEGIRRYCRNHINLAKLFEKYAKRDERFEVCGPVRYGLVAFRLRGLNEVTSRLLDVLNYSRKIHMVPSHFHDKVVIRFALCAEWANEEDIDTAWQTIDAYASVIIRQFEKENAGDSAMKNLYAKQKHHDELAQKKKDANVQREEAEASAFHSELQAKMKQRADGLLQAVDYAAVDGSWDHGDSDTFKKFDEYLHSHPELTEDDTYHDPNFPTKVQSMLHIELLEATAHAHDDSPDATKSKSKGAVSGGPSKSALSSGASKAGVSGGPSVQIVSGDASQAAASGGPSGGASAQPSAMSQGAASGGASAQPSAMSQGAASGGPSGQPSGMSQGAASGGPSGGASAQPSAMSQGAASGGPSGGPSAQPSSHSEAAASGGGPSAQPSAMSQGAASGGPSAQPSVHSEAGASGGGPSAQPSAMSQGAASGGPSAQPSVHSEAGASGGPSVQPSTQAVSGGASVQPSQQAISGGPSGQPSQAASSAPSGQPSQHSQPAPSGEPSAQPSQHSQISGNPSQQEEEDE